MANASGERPAWCGGVLFLIFLVLKLVGTISWSWWWVTSPLWIPAAIILAIMVILLLTACLLGE